MSGSLTTATPASRAFQSAVKSRKPDKRKRTPPVSIRFSDEERDMLAAHAGNQRLSTYVRRCVLKAHGAKRKPHKAATTDRQEVARALSALGRSDLASLLRRTLEAASIGTVKLDRDTQADLRLACAELSALRCDLMNALGLRRPS